MCQATGKSCLDRRFFRHKQPLANMTGKLFWIMDSIIELWIYFQIWNARLELGFWLSRGTPCGWKRPIRSGSGASKSGRFRYTSQPGGGLPWNATSTGAGSEFPSQRSRECWPSKWKQARGRWSTTASSVKRRPANAPRNPPWRSTKKKRRLFRIRAGSSFGRSALSSRLGLPEKCPTR